MDKLFEFSRTGEVAELIIRDYTGKKVDKFRWDISNKNLEKKIYNIVKRKYGIFKEDNASKKDLDLEWLNKID